MRLEPDEIDAIAEAVSRKIARQHACKIMEVLASEGVFLRRDVDKVLAGPPENVTKLMAAIIRIWKYDLWWLLREQEVDGLNGVEIRQEW